MTENSDTKAAHATLLAAGWSPVRIDDFLEMVALKSVRWPIDISRARELVLRGCGKSESSDDRQERPHGLR
jgi:hypothetical protein